MPEGRFLSKSAANSQQLAGVSFIADYLFIRCIPFLDREGRLVGEPKAVRAQCCPLRDEVTDAAVEVALAQLHEAHLVVWYQVKGEWYLSFPGFDRHQRGMRKDREAPSRIPPVSQNAVKYSDQPDLFRRYSAALADQLRTNSGLAPVRLLPSEGKGSEGKGEPLSGVLPSGGEISQATALPPGAAAVADLTRSLCTLPGQRRVA